MISKLVRVTVETNSLTAGIAIVALIVYLAVPKHTALVVPPTAMLGKLYTNCLIAVLNNRVPQVHSSGYGSNSATYGSSYTRSHLADTTPASPNTASHLVKVDVLQQVKRDEDVELDSIHHTKRVISRA
ncbi:hypothetical protein V5O48_006718 [Marasmius crinis-equi]|uniref:DUF6534 domain-containing protein n=1 Tax=Marasmius crinis-equi TaxID=585013 RepID=A0ABR3FIT0_9AGAR